MARVSNTLIGKSSGSVGNATFSTWKGINVLKEKAVSVANPDTDAQQMRRSALSQVVAIFRLISSVVNLGFKKLAIGKSQYNAFASDALLNAFDYSTPPTASIETADIKISKGTIAPTAIATAVADRSSNTIAFTFSSSITGAGQSLSDGTLIAAFNSDTLEWTAGIGTGTRSAGTATLALPAAWSTGDVLVMYLGFYNPTSGESSDSANDSSAIVA